MQYRGAHYLSATYEFDPTVMRRWVPSTIRFAQPYRVDVFCAAFPQSLVEGPYLEAGILVHVKTAFGVGVHCPWMIVDNDFALIEGRELAGYPKKMGEFTFTINDIEIHERHSARLRLSAGDTVHAEARRNGKTLITMDGTVGAEPVAPSPYIGRHHRNVLGLQSVSIPRVVAFKPIERHAGTRDADLAVQISGSIGDPLSDLGIGEQISGRLNVVDILGVAIPPIPILPVSPAFHLRNFRLRTS
ncbi:acetoacetate decarboxylase family protein [Mycobacteroides immunogenum]|nr:acetoacetate decarboxylase family protein [Mycobacteroides immunogenum]